MVILGETSVSLEVIVPITVRDHRGDTHDLTAGIDTGFTGHLTLPPEIIEALQLPETRSGVVTLGDGSERELQRCFVTVLWEGQDVTVEALRAEGLPLIGMRLLKGMVGTFHFADGGPATLFRP